jgi:adenosylmethionine-8-amino-7-oxononanoate aminotransferase
MMVGIELVEDAVSRRHYPMESRIGHRVARVAREHGLLLRPLGNVIVLMPPLMISIADLTRMVAILEQAIMTVTEQAERSSPPCART